MEEKKKSWKKRRWEKMMMKRIAGVRDDERASESMGEQFAPSFGNLIQSEWSCGHSFEQIISGGQKCCYHRMEGAQSIRGRREREQLGDKREIQMKRRWYPWLSKEEWMWEFIGSSDSDDEFQEVFSLPLSWERESSSSGCLDSKRVYQSKDNHQQLTIDPTTPYSTPRPLLLPSTSTHHLRREASRGFSRHLNIVTYERCYCESNWLIELNTWVWVCAVACELRFRRKGRQWMEYFKEERRKCMVMFERGTGNEIIKL